MDNKNNVVIFQSNVQNVKKEWIDYNGHMNVAYYTLAFDNSLDDFLETILEIGPTYVNKEKQGPYSLQANYHYLDELILGDKFLGDLSRLLSSLISLCGALGTPIGSGPPFAINAAIPGPATQTLVKAQNMLNKIQQYKSKVSKSK